MTDWEERGKKMETTGKKIQGLGCLLTMLFTIPIVLTIFLGSFGLVIGIFVAIIGLVGYFKKKD